MLTKHAIRGVQTLLVVAALTFAAVGLAVPQEVSRDTACATALNPKPPCDCNESAECDSWCYITCGLNYFAYCQPNDQTGSVCDASAQEYNGLCACYCL